MRKMGIRTVSGYIPGKDEPVKQKKTGETRKAEPRNMTRLEKIEKRIKYIESLEHAGIRGSAERSYLKHLRIEREKEMRK